MTTKTESAERSELLDDPERDAFDAAFWAGHITTDVDGAPVYTGPKELLP